MRHLPVPLPVPLFVLSALLAVAPFATPAAAQDAPPLRDFSLPPAPTPTARPQVQGPVDPDAPLPATPRVIAPPAPRPTPTPTLAPPPAIRLPDPAPAVTASPASRPAAAPPAARPLPAPSAPVPAAPIGSGSPAASLPPPGATGTLAPSAQLPPQTDRSAATTSDTAMPPASSLPGTRWDGALLWPLLAGLGIAAVAAGAAWRRRRRSAARPARIERPVVPANDDDGVGGPGGGDPLKIELVAVKLTRSFMNAALSYRITLHNRRGRALENVTVAGELIGAHGSQPLESQIASTGTVLPTLHRVERLSSGQARSVDGTATLPLQAITPIRQGSAALFVPLLRLVVSGDGLEPLARTFVVGQPGAGMTGRLTPFRLDEPPRSYQPLGQRALD